MTAAYVTAHRRQAGATLLEVLVALSLLATAMLGAAAAQLDALRRAEGEAQREQASWIGASLAEAMHSSEAAGYARARAQARASVHLPGARAEVLDQADGVGQVTVHWAHRGIASDPWQALVERPCPVGEEVALMRCLAFPFVSEK